MDDITIIISVHNASGWVKHCIENVKKNTTSSYKLIVIDNGSKSKTKEILSQFGIDNLISNGMNMGSYFGWNQGLNYVDTEYLAILHSDCLVSPNWDVILKKGLDRNENIVAASPITNYADQFYLNYSQNLFDDYVKLKPPNKISLSYDDIRYLLDEYYMFDNGFENFSRKVFEKFRYSFRFLTEMGTHCVLFKSPALFRFDGFDTDFFPHFGAEKVLLKKMSKIGWDYIGCMGSFCHHHGNATSDGPGFNMSQIMEKSEKLVKRKILI